MIIGGTPTSELSTVWTPTTNIIDVGGQTAVPSAAVWQPMDTINGVPVGMAGGQSLVGGGGVQAGNAGLVPFMPGTGVQPVATAPANVGAQIAYNYYAPAGTTTPPAAPAPAPAPAPAAAKPVEKPAEKPAPKTVKVKAGDNLSKIAAANGTTWQKLYELNKGVIGSNPNLIRPGQELKLP